MNHSKKKILFIELFKFAGAPNGLVVELEELLKHKDYEPLIVCSKGGI